MDIKKFEDTILTDIETVILEIIKKNKKIPIQAKSRAGAEISNFLENEFIKISKKNKAIMDAVSSPSGATKNPWDAKFTYKLKDREEIIWLDFKAFKVSGEDSNPDIGTPNKFFDLVRLGGFYLTFVYVYYEEFESGIQFTSNKTGKYTKVYFLKDIHHSVRRNPKNQLQVNISENPEYRTRTEFLHLLINKITESHKRQIEISKRELLKLSKQDFLQDLLKVNEESEKLIKKL